MNRKPYFTIGDKFNFPSEIIITGIQNTTRRGIVYNTNTGLSMSEVELLILLPYAEHIEAIKSELSDTEELPAQKPIKLYCVKEPEISWVRESLTKGKIYEFDGHRIEYDDGSSAWFTDFKTWKHGNPNYAACLVPLVKRPAKVGEWIYVIESPFCDNHGDYREGEIYRVEEIHGTEKYVKKKPGEHPCSIRDLYQLLDNEYLVLDGYQPEPEYYNGKVVCIKAGSYHTAGKVYEVKNGVVNCDYDDSGEFTYNIITPVKTLEQLNANGPVQFIEFKGEVTND